MDQDKRSRLFQFLLAGWLWYFSINPTETDKVINYIQLQQEHHKHKNFQDEFIAFLKKYQVEYDERYIWD